MARIDLTKMADAITTVETSIRQFESAGGCENIVSRLKTIRDDAEIFMDDIIFGKDKHETQH